MQKNILIFAITVLFVGAASFLLMAGQYQTPPIETTGQENIANLTLNFGTDAKVENVKWDVELKELSFANGQTAFAFTEENTKSVGLAFEYKEYAGLGKLVSKIGEKTNGDGNNYWQYYVDGKRAAVGADSYLVKPRDTIEWRFEPFTPLPEDQ